MGSIVRQEQIAAGLVSVRPLLEPADGACPVVAAASLPAAAVASPVGDEAVGRQLRLLNALAANLAHERSRQLSELRPELLRLVLIICGELLGREVATAPAVVAHTLDRALEVLGGAGAVVARLHPDDAAFLTEQWEALPVVERPEGVQLLPDSSLQRGECRLESDRGEVDATWATQLRLVAETLQASDSQAGSDSA